MEYVPNATKDTTCPVVTVTIFPLVKIVSSETAQPLTVSSAKMVTSYMTISVMPSMTTKKTNAQLSLLTLTLPLPMRTNWSVNNVTSDTSLRPSAISMSV